MMCLSGRAVHDGPGKDTTGAERSLNRRRLKNSGLNRASRRLIEYPRVRPHALGVDRPMRNVLCAGKLLLLDLASTIFFLVVLLLTGNILLSVGLGMMLGVAQIGWQLARKKPRPMG